MNVGDLIIYWFAGKYPYTGIVMKVRDAYTYSEILEGTYKFTVDLILLDGSVSTFDVHTGDEWELISCGSWEVIS